MSTTTTTTTPARRLDAAQAMRLADLAAVSLRLTRHAILCPYGREYADAKRALHFAGVPWLAALICDDRSLPLHWFVWCADPAPPVGQWRRLSPAETRRLVALWLHLRHESEWEASADVIEVLSREENTTS